MSQSGARILIVDDNDDNRFTLKGRLKRHGYTQVTEAANGREALEKLAQAPVDLVLLDIMMPELDGYQTLERLKADPVLRHIPVVMISAVDELESVIKCIEMGADDYLPKPFNPTLLRARVSALLEKKRLHDAEALHAELIDAERQRADELLYAILPPMAVQELKNTGVVAPRRYEGVAVIFCDLVGFTSYCDRHAPEQAVAQLQGLIETFEGIVQSHGLEKIKTIGDAVMVMSGLLVQVDNPKLAALRCGLELIDACRRADPPWEARVGLNYGAVVAGVVGHKQYLFDVWGDTVNVAAHLVNAGRPGTVTLTQAAWEDVRHLCRARALGPVEVKGKGLVEVMECDGLA